MSWVDRKDELETKARQIDPAVHLTTKDGWFWKALAAILLVLSFGTFKRERFLERFATTIGPLQAYPREWSAAQVAHVLIHESRHTRQFRVCGFFIHPWVGVPLMALIYGLLPLPAGLAVFRAWLELDADRYRWRVLLEQGKTPPDWIRRRAESFAMTVSGPSYIWSLPRPWLEKWFRRAAEKVIAEHAKVA